jgi:serine protease inhibitor
MPLGSRLPFGKKKAKHDEPAAGQSASAASAPSTNPRNGAPNPRGPPPAGRRGPSFGRGRGGVRVDLAGVGGGEKPPGKAPGPKRGGNAGAALAGSSAGFHDLDRFALALLATAWAQSPDGGKNVVFGPASIQLCLSMCALGAGGSTLSEFASALSWPESYAGDAQKAGEDAAAIVARMEGAEDLQFESANALVLRDGSPLDAKFQTACRELFGALVHMGGSSAEMADVINAFVDEKTHGVIPKIVGPGDLSGVLLALVNATYFKAEFADKFEEHLTMPETPFHGLGDADTVCTMMQRKGKMFYWETGAFQAAALPYRGGGDWELVVLLPKQTGHGGLTETLQAIQRAPNEMQHGREKVDLVLQLPKFKVEERTVANDLLRKMGLEAAFAATSADFTATGVPDLYIDQVIHKASIEVDEKGTVAAAATVVAGRGGGRPRIIPNYTMRCDRPFVCLVRCLSEGLTPFAAVIASP